MDVFVVVTRFMDVPHDGPVFSSRERAERFIANKSKAGDPTVERCPVIGGVVEPGVVYTSAWFDSSADLHHFEAVYGTYEAADRAAGEHGIVLRRLIDGETVAP